MDEYEFSDICWDDLRLYENAPNLHSDARCVSGDEFDGEGMYQINSGSRTAPEEKAEQTPLCIGKCDVSGMGTGSQIVNTLWLLLNDHDKYHYEFKYWKVAGNWKVADKE